MPRTHLDQLPPPLSVGAHTRENLGQVDPTCQLEVRVKPVDGYQVAVATTGIHLATTQTHNKVYIKLRDIITMYLYETHNLTQKGTHTLHCVYLDVNGWHGNLSQFPGEFNERAAGGKLDGLPLSSVSRDVVVGEVDVCLTQLLHGMDQGRPLGMESAYETLCSLHLILHIRIMMMIWFIKGSGYVGIEIRPRPLCSLQRCSSSPVSPRGEET